MLTRALLLSAESGPFPSQPHGRVNYLFLGLVASVLGALAPAALLTADYTAGVFLGLGLTQFHTLRQIERNMLISLEDAQLVPRGKAYVEGIAMALETRNYLAMLGAMAAASLGLVFGLLAGAGAGVAAALLLAGLARAGRRVGTVADVEAAEVARCGDAVTVGGMPVVWQPPPEVVAALPHALGLTVRPHDLEARLTLAQPGQRQALLHDLTAHLGVCDGHGGDDSGGIRGAPPPSAAASGPAGTRDAGGEADGSAVAPLPHVGGGSAASLADAGPARVRPLLPRAVLDPSDGTVAILLFPRVRHAETACRIAGRTPLLETLAHRWLRGRPAATGAAGAPGTGAWPGRPRGGAR